MQEGRSVVSDVAVLVGVRGIVLEGLNCIHMALNRDRKIMKSVDVDLEILVKLIRDEVK
jgi:hypothetical protein